MNEKMTKNQYQCCICKEPIIEDGKDEKSPLDPCALIIQSNINLNFRHRKEQVFYGHFECIRKIINKDGVLYIMDEDFPKIGETDENS